MRDLSVILTFTGGLAAALLFGFLAQKLRVSAIVGYLLGGILVGPFTPGFVANRAIAEQFAEAEAVTGTDGAGLRESAEQRDAIRMRLYGVSAAE